MLNTGSQNEHVTGTQRVRVADSLEDDFTLEHLYGDRSLSVMRGHVTVGSDGNDREPERSFLDERARGASVPGEESLIDYLLVRGQVLDQDFTFYGAVH